MVVLIMGTKIFTSTVKDHNGRIINLVDLDAQVKLKIINGKLEKLNEYIGDSLAAGENLSDKLLETIRNLDSILSNDYISS